MNLADMFDVGRKLKAEAAMHPQTMDSSSTEDGVAVNGLAIDRLALDRRFYSAKAVVTGRATMSTTKTATVALAVLHGDSSGTATTAYSTETNASRTLGSTGATGAQAVDYTVEQSVNLRGAKRWIRIEVTPTLAATSSGETLSYAGTLVFGGADEDPTTSS